VAAARANLAWGWGGFQLEEGGRDLRLWDGFARDLRAHYGVSCMGVGALIKLYNTVVEDCGYGGGGGVTVFGGGQAVMEGCRVLRCVVG
jgi:hypothetical protein